MEASNTADAAKFEGQRTKSFGRYMPCIARVLMGVAFTIFGLNGFLDFIPKPKDMPPGTGEFFGALMKTGYMIPLIFAAQLLAGVLLLLNRFVPLALALIAPVIVNIIAFHIFLNLAGIGPGLVILVLELYLAWAYRKSFRPMLAFRTEPA